MISEALSDEIAAHLEQTGLSEAVLLDLRARYPDLHFTYCMDDDINNGTPVLSRPTFNLYLIDSREHCLCLTSNREAATGLVLAEVIPDEDD